MNVRKIFENSELAFAAYATLTVGSTGDPDRVRALQVTGNTLMSSTQAQQFAQRYTSVLAVANDAASGFQASVFRDSTGSLTLAIRGTVPSDTGDLRADKQIAAGGAAYEQIVAMYNWWQRVSQKSGTQVRQFGIVDGNLVAATAQATGELNGTLAATPKLSVTGHSLGGHLAMAFGSLFASSTGQVTVFNAPGFKEAGGSLNFSDPPVSNAAFFAALGGSIPSGVNTVNVIADEAGSGSTPWSAIADLHSRPGEAVNIPIENQLSEPLATIPAAFNHSQMVLVDALAVYRMLGQLDAKLAQPNNAVLKALRDVAANQSHQSLERMVDALERLLGINRTEMATGNDQREALYQAINDLQNNTTFKALAGKLSLMASAASASAAKSDFAQFLSLYDLSPITMSTTDAGAKAALLAARTDVASLWQNNLADNFSDKWLQDRSAMQGWLMYGNKEDIGAIGNTSVIRVEPLDSRINFEDATTGKSIKINPMSADTSQMRNFHFGDASANSYTGGGLNDGLYGGAGNDTLIGLGGNNYLEGGAGDDKLIGGNGNDNIQASGNGNSILDGGNGDDSLAVQYGNNVMYGGQGNDRLGATGGNNLMYGGLGNDTLTGGTGNDTLMGGDGNASMLAQRLAALADQRHPRHCARAHRRAKPILAAKHKAALQGAAHA
jgi:Ca2+-binding RTX toxin-like protein